MDPTAHATRRRVSRLKRRFLDVLSGSVKLDSRGGGLFLEGLCAQDDPVGCLNEIIQSAHGLSSIQSAVQFDLSVQFTNGLGSTVLEYFLRTSDVGGDALDRVLFHVVEPPIFWDAFVSAFRQGTLTEDAQLVFTRVLCRLLTLPGRDTTPYREVAAQPFIKDGLIASSRHEIREIGHLIRHILSSNGPISVYDVLDERGGRHDNDFADYHDISILPTADEILCQKPPFLRTPSWYELNTSETSVEDYLDNAFRMLREDMLSDIRNEIQTTSQKKGKHPGSRVIGTVYMLGLYTGTAERETRWAVKLRCDSDFKELKKMKDERARLDFLTRDPRGSRILRHQSLVYLASGQDIISFGTVNRVEKLLAMQPPVIVLQLDGSINIRKALTTLSTAMDVRLIQLNAATFSFEPVLTTLQKMGSVPLTKEVLFWGPETPLVAPRDSVALLRIASAVASNLSVDLRSLFNLPMCICLDKSQANSLIAGLTKRVSLIQGPPGTGKSFMGTILAKAIHDKTSKTILVVCYTNHALDQFLGDLLKCNIPPKSIVRLGSRANNAIEHLSLQKQPRGRFQYDRNEIARLKNTAAYQEEELETHFDTLLDINDNTTLMSHLRLQHRDFFEAFDVPMETEDEMILIGKNGEAIDDGYLFSRWTRGLDAGVLSDNPHFQASAWIWGMDHSARQQRLEEWHYELITKATEGICQAGREYNKARDAIREEFGESTVAILRQKRIVACTTTGAAIYAEAIKKVGPEFLLVEEAGEILEAHILASLSHKVEQMILIGDHKQLRPKVNNYQLTVESGEGFDLNRSLFERLILKGYPHETLSTQHRMRPEISTFVRELTYPELIDAPSTQRRPDIRGVNSNVIFVDHSYPEDDDALIGDRADGGAKTSKRNMYEVEMVLKIVRYLAQQGYKSEDIVILTPYLGQLHLLRDALKQDSDPILNELDSSDLARAGLSPAPTGLKAKKGQIHLATIDNYQGEESNIVVASLTRSNKSNAIGFMDSPERLNVLLSRARDGLILVGNSQTFLHSKKGGALWRRFFTLLEKGQYAYQGFPTKCERHPKRAVLLKHANDFDDLCPDGGCTEPCGFTLACGHVCPKKCHPRRLSGLLDLHDVSQCRVEQSAMCAAGHHRITWECRLGQPANCSTCTDEAKRLEEIAQQALELQRKREEAEAEHRRRMVELETRLRAVKVIEERESLGEQGNQEKEIRMQRGEEDREREEEKKRREKERKREEKKKRREEKRVRKEKKREREENIQQLQDATHLREEEEKRQDEVKRMREEQAERLREATCKRMEDDERRRREEDMKEREEQTRRLQEATYRRREEEHERREQRRKRDEQTERLREATHKRWEEAERKKREEEMMQRAEQTRRLREATDRRHEQEERKILEEQRKNMEERTKRLAVAARQRRVGHVEQSDLEGFPAGTRTVLRGGG